MKTIPIITFFLCTVMYAHAQLNIVPKNDGLKEYTVTNAHPYDSLTNVEKRSFTSLPGQTLYMHGVKNDSNGYWAIDGNSYKIGVMCDIFVRFYMDMPCMCRKKSKSLFIFVYSQLN